MDEFVLTLSLTQPSPHGEGFHARSVLANTHNGLKNGQPMIGGEYKNRNQNDEIRRTSRNRGYGCSGSHFVITLLRLVLAHTAALRPIFRIRRTATRKYLSDINSWSSAGALT
jgi:hypothetical protein